MTRLLKHAVLLMVLLAVGHDNVWAQTRYVKDLLVYVGYGSGTLNRVRQTYEPMGYTVVAHDLNEGTGSDSYIYLLYTTTTDFKAAVTDIVVMNGKGSVKIDGVDYTTHTNEHLEKNGQPIVFDKRDWFLSSYVEERDSYCGDLNRGAGGDDLVLYYTRDGNKSAFTENFLTGVTVDYTSSGAVTNQGGTPQDLTQGTGGKKYIYFHKQTHTHAWQEGNVYSQLCGRSTYAHHKCTTCGEEYKGNTRAPYQHNFDQQGICTVCGMVEGSNASMFSIGTSQQLKNYAYYVNTLNGRPNAVLTSDMAYPPTYADDNDDRNAAEWLIGTTASVYAGTFDGQGHRVTLDLTDADTKNLALFSATDGATIKNLCTKGKLKANRVVNQYIGGLAGECKNTSIYNCHSEVDIQSTLTQETSMAGIAAHTEDVNITNCSYAGSIVQNNAKSGCAGICARLSGRTNIVNCLSDYDHTKSVNPYALFMPEGQSNVQYNNCYYNADRPFATQQGLATYEHEMLTGVTSQQLNKEANPYGPVWVQQIGKDKYPISYAPNRQNVLLLDGNAYVSFDYNVSSQTRVACHTAGTDKATAVETKAGDTHITIGRNSSIQIYNVRVYEAEELKADLIPSVYDGNACLWDRIGGQRYALQDADTPSATQCAIGCGHTRTHEMFTAERLAYSCDQCGYIFDAPSSILRLNGTYVQTDIRPTQLTSLSTDLVLRRESEEADYPIFGAQMGESDIFSLTYNMSKHAWQALDNSMQQYTSIAAPAPLAKQHNILYKADVCIVDTTHNQSVSNWRAKWQLKDFQATGDLLIGTKPGSTTRSPIDLYQTTVMTNGEATHQFVPARFGGEAGLCDTLNNVFYPVADNTKASVYIQPGCQHRQYVVDRDTTNATQGNHCHICDKRMADKYYAQVIYDANGGRGIIHSQFILDKDTITTQRYTRDNYYFDHWNTEKNGTGLTVMPGDTLQLTNSINKRVTLYAQWAPGFSYNGKEVMPARAPYTDNIAIVDDKENPFLANGTFNAKAISYTRVDPDNAYGTLCLPFPYQKPDGLELYRPVAVEGTKLIVESVTAVEAGEAVIYHKSEGTATITVEANNCTVVSKPLAETCNMHMMGTFEYTSLMPTDEVNRYGIMNDHFWLAKTSIVMNPFRAILECNNNSPVKLQIVADGEETHVESLNADTASDMPNYFSLDGKRVAQPTKGLYIIRYTNGQSNKIIIK